MMPQPSCRGATLTEADVGALVLFTFTQPTDRALTGWGTSVLADHLLDALWAADRAATMAESRVVR